MASLTIKILKPTFMLNSEEGYINDITKEIRITMESMTDKNSYKKKKETLRHNYRGLTETKKVEREVAMSFR